MSLKIEIEQLKKENRNALRRYEESLEKRIDISSLYQRNNTAHKWKVTFSVYAIRETSCWRFVDILRQAIFLSDTENILGARIMTRAAIETLASLVFINKKMENLVEGKIEFIPFCQAINSLFLGSRVNKDLPQTVNVLTMVENFEKVHKGIKKYFDDLCESAHPSYEGLTMGYAKINRKEFVADIGNFWAEKWGYIHEFPLRIAIEIFESEYNDIWKANFEKMEMWLVENDARLESERTLRQASAQSDKDSSKDH
jgi:hypothetical protein